MHAAGGCIMTSIIDAKGLTRLSLWALILFAKGNPVHGPFHLITQELHRWLPHFSSGNSTMQQMQRCHLVVVSSDETEWPWVRGAPVSQQKSPGCWCLLATLFKYMQIFSRKASNCMWPSNWLMQACCATKVFLTLVTNRQSDRMDSNKSNMVGWAFGATSSAISRHWSSTLDVSHSKSRMLQKQHPRKGYWLCHQES